MFLSANSRLTGGVASRRAFPAGTQLMFINAAAPVGWVRVTTFDDALMRIVASAVPSFGGANGFVATFNSQTGTGTGTTGTGTTGTGTTGTGTSGSYTLQIADIPPHTHAEKCDLTGSGPNGLFPAAGGNGSAQGGGASGSVGGGGGHSHSVPGLSVPGLSVPGLSIPSLSITTSIKYVDALIASKK
jgi:hypothetical protein